MLFDGTLETCKYCIIKLKYDHSGSVPEYCIEVLCWSLWWVSVQPSCSTRKSCIVVTEEEIMLKEPDGFAVTQAVCGWWSYRWSAGVSSSHNPPGAGPP